MSTPLSHSRLYKPLLALLAVALLFCSSAAQRGLNRARGDLGFTRLTPLENAPPVLVLTTVVLGGFRGLIANALWIRAMELQEQDKYFEMVQLADWITKLQPHMTTVWIVQAWNMSYNISIKFSDPPDRWLWVLRGIELLRDQALKYNPDEVLLYRELAWHFQHKMGHYLDDAHLYYKNVWATEMQQVLGGGRPNFEELINPKTDQARASATLLREKYKMDPAIMKAVDDQYGPLEWRFPETHAIYWAWVGRTKAKGKKEDLITLRRVIFQSMQLAFQRGRLVKTPFDNAYTFEPNLDIIDKTNAAYEDMMAEDVEMREHIGRGHKNFLLDAVYFLYTSNRMREAAKWLEVVKQKYPKDYPAAMSLDDYALKRVGEDVGETDMNRTIANISGFLLQSFVNMVSDEDDKATAAALLARKIYERYQGKILKTVSDKRVGLPSFESLREKVLSKVLDPEQGFKPELAAIVRTKLGLPAASGTNAPPARTQPQTQPEPQQPVKTP